MNQIQNNGIKHNQESLPDDIVEDIILNFFKKITLNNLWLVSQQNSTSYTHEMIYFVLYVSYIIIKFSGYNIEYLQIKVIWNNLRDNGTLRDILLVNKNVLNRSHNYNNDNPTEIFSDCFDLFGLEVKFPNFPKDTTGYIIKKVREIANRSKVRVLNPNSGEISSRNETGEDYLLHALSYLIFYRAGDMASDSDFLVIGLFFMSINNILGESKLKLTKDKDLLAEMIRDIFIQYKYLIKYKLLNLPKQNKKLSKIQIKRRKNKR